jgi:hypothetical protein
VGYREVCKVEKKVDRSTNDLFFSIIIGYLCPPSLTRWTRWTRWDKVGQEIATGRIPTPPLLQLAQATSTMKTSTNTRSINNSNKEGNNPHEAQKHIPTEELDKLFDLEPDPNQEPIGDGEWFRQTQRDDEAKYHWMSEKARAHQQEFLLRLDVSKRRSKLKRTT